MGKLEDAFTECVRASEGAFDMAEEFGDERLAVEGGAIEIFKGGVGMALEGVGAEGMDMAGEASFAGAGGSRDENGLVGVGGNDSELLVGTKEVREGGLFVGWK